MAQAFNLSPGDQRQITADSPSQGYSFNRWIGDTSFLADPTQAQTIVTMGQSDVTVTATYTQSGNIPTRYVATAQDGGSDSNSGDLESPYLTLEKAFQEVTTPGHKIHVGPGTFALPQNSHVQLWPGVSLEGEGIDITTITASYVSVNRNDAAIQMISSSFDYSGSLISDFTLDGGGIASRAFVAWKRGNVEVARVKCQNFTLSAFVFWASDYEWDTAPDAYILGNKIHHCQVVNCCRFALQADQYLSNHVRINAQDGFLCHDNTFTQTGNSLGQNGDIWGGEWNKNLKIYGNTLTKPDDNGSQWNFFCELFRFIGGGEIYNNTFYGNATLDIVEVRRDYSQSAQTSYGCRIYDNVFLPNTGSGKVVYPESHGNPSIDIETRGMVEYLEIFRNTFVNLPNPIWFSITVPTYEGISQAITRYVDVHHNEMHDCGAANHGGLGIWFYNYNSAENGYSTNITTQDVRINNNTIVSSNSGKLWCGIEYKAMGSCQSLTMLNNIIYGCQKAIVVKTDIQGTQIENTNISYNQLSGNDYDTVDLNQSGDPSLDGDYPMAYTGGLLTGSNLTEDPGFVDNPNNLNLLSTSPCRNTGTYAGYTHLGNGPDRGCFEYVE